MNEHTIVVVLASGTVIGALGLFGLLFFYIRPRSIAYRLTGAAVVLVAIIALVVLQPVIATLQEASLAHAAVDSEAGTFVYAMAAEMILMAGALLMVAGSSFWRFGIARHPNAVSKAEHVAQIATLALPIIYLTFRCTWLR